jgi:hypothetical protein
MKLDVDPAKVLYAVGALFGVAAVLYFARDIVFELSITVRALLLLLAFVAFLVGAVASSRSPLVSVFAILSAAAYLAFVGYTLSRFAVGSDGTFFVLLVSAGLFLLLGYLVRERDVSPDPRTAQYVVLGLALAGLVLVGADVVASDVEYEVSTAEDVGIESEGQVAVGTLTIDNRFVFREPVDAPDAVACIYVPEFEAYEMRPEPVQYRVDGDGVPNSIPGSRTISARMLVGFHEEEAANVTGPIPIERVEKCPAESAEPRITVVVGGEAPHPPPPSAIESPAQLDS